MKIVRTALSLLLILCLVLPLVPVQGAQTSQSVAAPSVEPIQSPAVEETSDSHSRLESNCRILRYVDEEVFRSREHIARFKTEETLSSYVFLNRDGTKTVYYMDEPVKFRDAGGRIWEKDLTLTAASGGYTTVCNDVSLTLPEDPASGIRLGSGGRQIALIPQGGALKETAAVTDSTVTYPDYFGDGMSLRYTPTLSGVKEDIILDAYAGVNSFTFTLNTGGLNLYQAGGNWFLAETKLSDSRIELGDIVAFDAHGKFSIGTLTAETVMPGQSYRLTLTVDEAFLTNEATTYPVIIDPTLTITDGSGTTGAIEDATVYSGSTSLNTGDWLYHHIGYYDATYGTGQTVVRLSGLLSGEVYAAAEADWFTEAKFYVYDASGNSGQTVELYPMVSNTTWTESGITWNDKGTSGSEAYASVTMSAGGQGVFDILSLLKDWKNGEENANAGFVLVADDSNTAVASLYASEHSDSSKRPYAVVTYENDVWINTDIVEIGSGTSTTVTAGTKIEGDTVTWTSANTAIATVTKTGDYTCRIDGVKSGYTTITATLPNGKTATCEVYVTITNGTYFIRHVDGLYLGVDQGMLENTAVELLAKKSGGPAQLRQIWKVQHIERDLYSVRSVYRLGMALHGANSTGVDVASLDTDLAQEEITYTFQWKIGREGNYFTFGSTGTQALTMRPAEETPTAGTELTLSPGNAYLWSLEWKTVTDQILLINTKTGLPAQNAVRYVAPGETKTLAELNLMATFVSKNTNEQDLVWSVPTWPHAVIDSVTGTVTGLSYRETPLISVSHRTLSLEPKSYTLSVTISPTSPPLKPQETDYWCWAAAIQMVVLEMYPTMSVEQSEIIRSQFGEAILSGSYPILIAEGINDYLLDKTGIAGDFTNTSWGTVLTEEGLLGYLDAGHLVIVNRHQFSGNSLQGTKGSGHAIVVCDYVEVSGVNYFLIMDPSPVDEGTIYGFTYDELRESECPISGNYFFWDSVIADNNQYIEYTVKIR